jgi:Chitin binding Peritrophin-A domain.
MSDRIFGVTEEPQPSLHCPRKNGYFSHEDAKICDKFYYCVDGKFNMISCPDGLVYNEKTGICTWPDEAKKKHCSSEGLYLVYTRNKIR